MKKVYWKFKFNWFWTRVYLLPVFYVGRHVVSHIVADTGPTWAIEVGFLFLTIDINRYVDSRTPATAPTATERVIAAAQQKRQRAGYPVCRLIAGTLYR